MKKTLVLCSMILFIAGLSAQKIKFKKDGLLCDGKLIMKVKDKGQETILFDLEGNEVLFMEYNRNGTLETLDDDYKKILFTQYGIRMIQTGQANSKYTIRKMFQNGIITTEGVLSKEKAEEYKLKYHDDIVINK